MTPEHYTILEEMLGKLSQDSRCRAEESESWRSSGDTLRAGVAKRIKGKLDKQAEALAAALRELKVSA